jgi:endonuclease/exonuclease/phosphatase family metal-dependent hydrolase
MKLIKVPHSIDLADLKSKISPDGLIYYSDHLPVTDDSAITLSWNIYERGKKWSNSSDTTELFSNNGFGVEETQEEYIKRRNLCLSYITNLAKKRTEKQLSNFVICLQEFQPTSPDEINHVISGSGFRVAAQQKYSSATGSVTYNLVMLYSESVEPITIHDPEKLNALMHPNPENKNPNRFQAVTFRHKASGQEFVVVNLHQEFSSVALNSKPGQCDAYNILSSFGDKPCIMTGDFNTKEIMLPSHAEGKLIIGENTNTIWDIFNKQSKSELGSCDHILMNPAYLQFAKLLGYREQVEVRASSSGFSFLGPEASGVDQDMRASRTFNIASRL